MIAEDPIELKASEGFQVIQDIVLSALLSAIAYGFVILLSVNGLWLVTRTAYSRSQTKRRRIFLAYITTMFLLSTGAMIQEIISTMGHLQQASRGKWNKVDSPSIVDIPLTAPFSILGADGLLVWRCFTLYRDVSKRSKILLYCTLGFLTLIYLVGFAGNIGLLITDHLPVKMLGFSDTTLGMFSITFSTFACNTIFSILIVCRMLQHNRQMRRLGQEFNKSLYYNIISMCIESAILIIGVSLISLFAIFLFPYGAKFYPLFLLPHVSVISPLLIIFRVAQGKAFVYGQEAAGRQPRSSIHFRSSRSLTSSISSTG